MPANRLAAILAGSRGITADTAIRPGKATGTTAEMWLGPQASHDLEPARQAHAGSEVEPIAA
jgi:antitoxin HigA-1